MIGERNIVGEWAHEPQVSEALDALGREGFETDSITDKRYSVFKQPEIKGRRVGFYAAVHKPNEGEDPVTKVKVCLDMDPTEGDREYERIRGELAKWRDTKQGELEAELQQMAGVEVEIRLPQAIETRVLPSFTVSGTDAGAVARKAKDLVEKMIDGGYKPAPKYFKHE